MAWNLAMEGINSKRFYLDSCLGNSIAILKDKWLPKVNGFIPKLKQRIYIDENLTILKLMVPS